MSNDDCLEDKREDCQNCSVLCCILQLCAMTYAHIYEQFLQLTVGLGLGLLFVCFFAILSLFACFCFVRFSLFSTKPGDWLKRTALK